MAARAGAVALAAVLWGARGMRDSYLSEELALGVSDVGGATTTVRADEKVRTRQSRSRSSNSPPQRTRASSDEEVDLVKSLESIGPGTRQGWSFSSEEDEEIVAKRVMEEGRRQERKGRKAHTRSSVDPELQMIWDNMKEKNRLRRRAIGLETGPHDDSSYEEVSDSDSGDSDEESGGNVVEIGVTTDQAVRQTRRHILLNMFPPVPLEDTGMTKKAKESAEAERRRTEELAQDAATRKAAREAGEREALERAEKLAQDPSRLLVHAVSFNVANSHSSKDKAWRDMLERISQGHEKADLAVFGFQELYDKNLQFAEMARRRLWREVSSERLKKVTEEVGPPQVRPSKVVLEEAMQYLHEVLESWKRGPSEVLEKRRDVDEGKLAKLLKPVINWLDSVLQKPDKTKASYPNLEYDEIGEMRIAKFKKKLHDLKATQKRLLEDAVEHMRRDDGTGFVTVQEGSVRFQANTKNRPVSYNPANDDNIKLLHGILESMLDVNPEIPDLGPDQVAVGLETATFNSGLKCHSFKHFDTNLYVFVNPWSKWRIVKEEYHSERCTTDGRSQGCSINNCHGSECGKVVNLLVFVATRTVAAQPEEGAVPTAGQIEVEVKFCVLNTHMSFQHDAQSRMTYMYNALMEAKVAGCAQVVFVGDFNSRSHCQLPQSMQDMTERWRVTGTRFWVQVYQRMIYDEAKSLPHPFNEHKSSATGGTSLQYVLDAFATGKPHWEGKSRYSLNSAHALAGPFEFADELMQLTKSEMVTCWEHHHTEVQTILTADAKKEDKVIQLDLTFDEGLQATPVTTTVTARAEKGLRKLTVETTDGFSQGDAVTICVPCTEGRHPTCQKTRIEAIIEEDPAAELRSVQKRFPDRSFLDSVDLEVSLKSKEKKKKTMTLADRLAMDCPERSTIVDESKTRKVRPGAHLELKSPGSKRQKDQTRRVKSVDVETGAVTLETALGEPLSEGDTAVVRGPKAPQRFENPLPKFGLKEGVVDFGPTYKLSERKTKEEVKKTQYCFQGSPETKKGELTAPASKHQKKITCDVGFDVGDEVVIKHGKSAELHEIKELLPVSGSMVLTERLRSSFGAGSEVIATSPQARKRCYGNSHQKGKHNPAWTDRVLVTGDAEVLFYDAINLESFESDHAPVMATVSIRAERRPAAPAAQ